MDKQTPRNLYFSTTRASNKKQQGFYVLYISLAILGVVFSRKDPTKNSDLYGGVFQKIYFWVVVSNIFGIFTPKIGEDFQFDSYF